MPMSGDPGPLVRRRQLGAALRSYREAAGLSAKDVAERLLSAPSKISRIETAQRNASLRDVRDLCEIYDIRDEAVRRQLMDLARGSRERGWWQGVELPPALESLIGMEGSAVTISEFELALVPGLLQTRDYAMALLEIYLPDSDAREAFVDIRMRRQEIFKSDSPPALNVVLDEAVLHRKIGGSAVMHKQLSHLAYLISERHVELRVIPFSAGAHWAMLGGFTILEFAPPGGLGQGSSASSVVYSESYGPGAFIDQNALVQQYLSAFAKNRALAQPPVASLDMLRSVIRDLRDPVA
jgi:transcriptional regulator with XRE-family HTH domain